MAVKFANLASSTLSGAITNSATSITVSDASSFPTLGSGDYFYASLGEGTGSEIVKVTAVSTNTFTVTRGQDGTSAQAWSSGTVIALRVVAAALDDIASQAQTAADTESVSIDGDTMTGDLTVPNLTTTGNLTVQGDNLDITQSIRHRGDENTGINFFSDQVAIKTGGTERLTVTNSDINIRNTQVFFNSSMGIGASTYSPIENNTDSERNWLNFHRSNNASYVEFTNRTPLGKIVLSGGLDGGGGEVQRLEIQGGSGTKSVKVLASTDLDLSSSSNFKMGGLNVITSGRNIQNIGNVNIGGYYAMDGTTIIDTSKNLVNIGTISSGAITSSGNITTSGQLRLNDGADIAWAGGYGSNKPLIAANGNVLKFYTHGASGGVELSLNGSEANFSGNNLTSVGTISSGAITASGTINANNGTVIVGTSSTNSTVRTYWSDGAYLDVNGWGLEFARNASYIRPNNDNARSMYFGTADLRWSQVQFHTPALKMGSTTFLDDGRNLLNIANSTSTGLISNIRTSAFAPDDSSAGLRLEYSGGDTDGDIGSGIVFAQRWYSGATTNVRTGGIAGFKNAGSGNFGGGLKFYTQPQGGSNMNLALTLDKNKNASFEGSVTASDDIVTTDSGGTNKVTLSRFTGVTFRGNGAGSRSLGTTSNDVLNLIQNNQTRMVLQTNGDVLVSNGLTVTGNLTVNGTTTTINTANLQVEDKNIVLNYSSGDSSSTADGAGITIQDAVNGSTDAFMNWNATHDIFQFSHSATFGYTTIDPDLFLGTSGGFGNIADGGGWSARGLYIHGGATGDAAAIGHNGAALYFGIQNNSTANSMATWLTVQPNKSTNFAAQLSVSGHGNSSQWNTAYGWGNHATAGYNNASNLSSGTLPSARLSGTYSESLNFSSSALQLKGHMFFNEFGTGRHYIHFKTSNSTNQVDWRIQTNNTNSTIHSWTESLATFRTPMSIVVGGSHNNTDANNRLVIDSSGHSYIKFVSPDGHDQGFHFYNTTDNSNVGRVAYKHNSAGDNLYFRVGTGGGDGQFLMNASGRFSASSLLAGNIDSNINGNNTSGGNIVLGATGNNAAKWFSITGRQYNSGTETEGYSLITGSVGNGVNNVFIGGGLGEQNAATIIQFMAASNTSTRNGTEIARINTDGLDIRNNVLRMTGSQVIDASRNFTGGSVTANALVLGSGNSNASIYRSGASGSGLHFTTNAIYPATETGAVANGTEDLGGASNKFKDGFFSGTVNAGALSTGPITGTGSTHYLGGIKIKARANGENYIAFGGTTGDQPNNYNHTYIGEHIYSSTEKSELLLAKFNDVEGSSGSDRIRLQANNILFDVWSSVITPSANDDLSTAAGLGSPSTAMMIKQSGQVLVGKTSTDDTVAGTNFEANASEAYAFTHGASGGWAMMINRQTSDGSFITFRKANAEVGKIVHESGTSRLTMGTGNAGLSFIDSGQDRIIPRLSGGGNANDAIDLGDGASQWRELYLSRGLRINSQTVINDQRHLQNIQKFDTNLIPRSFALPQTGGSTGTQWVYLGKAASISQHGASVVLRIHGNSGYNAGDAQNVEAILRFKTSNGSSTNTANTSFYGDAQLYNYGQNSVLRSAKIKQVSTTEFEFYIAAGQFTGDNSFYTVEHRGGIWTNGGTYSGTAPSGTVLDVSSRTIFTSGFNQNSDLLLGSGDLTATEIRATGSMRAENGLTVRNNNTNAALHFHTGDDFCGIGFNRNVADGSIYDSNINAFQMHIQNGVLEIETYNGSGTTQADNAWRLDTAGNMTAKGTLTTENKLVVNRSSASGTEPTAMIHQGGTNSYGFIAAHDQYHGIILRGIPNQQTGYGVSPGNYMSFAEFGGDFRFYTKSTSTFSLDAQILAGVFDGEGVKVNGTTAINSSGRATMSVDLPVDTGLYATDASLSYYGSSNAVYLNGAGADGWLRLNASGASNDRTSINLFGSNNGDNITLKTAGTQRMNIDSSGNLRWGSGNTAILDASFNLTNIANITTSGVIEVTANEGREIKTYMPSSYTAGDIVSGHEYGWYSDYWRVGMTRSGDANGDDFAFTFNNVEKASLSKDGDFVAQTGQFKKSFGANTSIPNVVLTLQANTTSTITTGGGTAIKFKGVSSGGNIQNYDQAMIASVGQATNNAHGLDFYYKPDASTALTKGLSLSSIGEVVVQNQLVGNGGINVSAAGGSNIFYASTNDSRVLKLRDRSSNNGNIVQFQLNNGTNIWELVGRDGSFYVYKNTGTGSGYKWQIDTSGNHTFTGGAFFSNAVTLGTNLSTTNAGRLRLEGTFGNNAMGSHPRATFNDENFGIGAGNWSGTANDDDLYLWAYNGAGRKIRFAATTNGNTDVTNSAWVTNATMDHEGNFDLARGDLTVPNGNLTLGSNGQTPKLTMMYTTGASAGWDTRIHIGRSDDLPNGAAFPTSTPAHGYGIQFQGNSDGAFFGIERYSSGNYRPVINWGDDTTDTPFRIAFNNGTRFQMDSSGNFTANGNVTAYSDAKLKDNVEEITDALEKVSKIRGVTYTRNDQKDTETRHMGVIAQEVEAAGVSEVVQYDAENDIKTVAYGNMVGLLIEAIKEQSAQIESLNKRIEELENGDH